MDSAKKLLAGAVAAGVGIGYWLAKPDAPPDAQPVQHTPVLEPVEVPAKSNSGSRRSWVQWVVSAILAVAAVWIGYDGLQSSREDQRIQQAQIQELIGIRDQLGEVDDSIGAVETGVSDVAVAVGVQPDASPSITDPEASDEPRGKEAETGLDEPGTGGGAASALFFLLLLGLFLNALGGKKKTEEKNPKTKGRAKKKK